MGLNMRNFTEWLRLHMRICLAATLFIEAAIGLLPQVDAAAYATVVGQIPPSLELHSTALSALYFVLSIWLMLGIRTSQVAFMSAILLIAPAIITTTDGDTALALKVTLVTVFSIPLIAYGGGRYTTLETREPWMFGEDDEEDDAIKRHAEAK